MLLLISVTSVSLCTTNDGTEKRHDQTNSDSTIHMYTCLSSNMADTQLLRNNHTHCKGSIYSESQATLVQMCPYSSILAALGHYSSIYTANRVECIVPELVVYITGLLLHVIFPTITSLCCNACYSILQCRVDGTNKAYIQRLKGH